MKVYNSLLVLLCTIFVSLLTACGNDDESLATELQGTWIGCHAYNNPVGGLKKNYLYITFKDGKTGDITYEGVSSYAYGVFTYRVSGNTIKCSGAWASTNDGEASEFTLTLEIQGDRLIPIDKFTAFILTRDGSVITDGDGNEAIDYSNLIVGVWLSSNQVVEFDYSTYTIYNMSSSTSYSTKETGSYSYDYITKKLKVGSVFYDVVTVNENSLSLRNSSGNTLNFRRGSIDDIPKEVNIRDLLISAMGWSTSNGSDFFGFFDNGVTTYIKQSDSNRNDCLSARGSYSVQGNKVTCYYDDISWERGKYPEYANIFPGWKYGGTKTKIYYIYENSSDVIKIVDSEDGKEYIVEKL